MFKVAILQKRPINEQIDKNIETIIMAMEEASENHADMVGESLGGYIYDHIERFEYKATMKDVDELVRTRIIVLRAANKLSDDVDMSLVEKESYAYYRHALKTESILHIWYMITESLSAQVESALSGYADIS